MGPPDARNPYKYGEGEPFESLLDESAPKRGEPTDAAFVRSDDNADEE